MLSLLVKQATSSLLTRRPSSSIARVQPRLERRQVDVTAYFINSRDYSLSAAKREEEIHEAVPVRDVLILQFTERISYIPDELTLVINNILQRVCHGISVCPSVGHTRALCRNG